jgi:hypothetical protein
MHVISRTRSSARPVFVRLYVPPNRFDADPRFSISLNDTPVRFAHDGRRSLHLR